MKITELVRNSSSVIIPRHNPLYREEQDIIVQDGWQFLVYRLEKELISIKNIWFYTGIRYGDGRYERDIPIICLRALDNIAAKVDYVLYNPPWETYKMLFDAVYMAANKPAVDMIGRAIRERFDPNKPKENPPERLIIRKF